MALSKYYIAFLRCSYFFTSLVFFWEKHFQITLISWNRSLISFMETILTRHRTAKSAQNKGSFCDSFVLKMSFGTFKHSRTLVTHTTVYLRFFFYWIYVEHTSILRIWHSFFVKLLMLRCLFITESIRVLPTLSWRRLIITWIGCMTCV